MKRFSAATICCISCGAVAATGFSSDGSRRDSSRSSVRNGRSARDTPSHTSAKASSDNSAIATSACSTTSCASASRARRVCPTCTHTWSCAAAEDTRRDTTAKRTGSPL
ncbi:hypothetical protein NB713_000992 [Xanthomonas sacchari]|nr:hypothetical protein [Xanthomonas sacchari]